MVASPSSHIRSAFCAVVALILGLAVPQSVVAAIPTEVAASFPIPPEIEGWFNDGAGKATDGDVVFDNREAQLFASSVTGELDRVEFSGFRTANTTAALRVNVARSTNGKPGEVIGTTTIEAAAVTTDGSGTPTMNLTALFLDSRVILRAGESYFLVFLSDTTEANYRLRGSDSGSGRFESQNEAPYTASSGALFHRVVVFSNQAPVAVDDVVPTRGGEVTFNPLANDSDNEDDVLMVTGVTLPLRGRTEIIDNQIRYTPNTSVMEPDFFTYTVMDSTGKTDTGSVKVLNPFTVVSGRSEATIGIGDVPSGRLALTITKRGQITGTLTIEGKKYTFRRTLGLDGTLNTTLRAPGREPVTLVLNCVNDEEPSFTGTVTVGDKVYEIGLGGLLIAKVEDPFRGEYTFRLPGNDDGNNPRGTGYATGALSRSGVLKLRGRLPDLTPFTAAIPLQNEGRLVVNRPLFRGDGYLHGSLFLDQNGQENPPTFTGNLAFKRPAKLEAPLFADGIEMTIPTTGTRYYPPQRDESAIGDDEARVVILPGEVEVDVLVTARDIVRPADPANPRKLTLQFNRATGKFSGSFRLANDEESTAFEGAWKWNAGFGEGLFLRDSQTVALIFGSPDRFPGVPE